MKKLFKFSFILLTIFFILIFQNAQAEVNRISLLPEKTKITFDAIGNPGFINIEGKLILNNGELKLKDEKFEGTIQLDLTKIETGIDLRDSHLKEKYLEIEKFPQAKLEIVLPETGNLKFLDESAENKFSLNLPGSFELHGVKKNIDLPIKGKKNADGSIEGNTEFEINLKDFGIEIPSFAGITVAEKVVVKVKFAGMTYSDVPAK